jgi:type II secretory ATPase GspE/PulE/Tfp pilus assembly ATPase PilB-like protein
VNSRDNLPKKIENTLKSPNGFKWHKSKNSVSVVYATSCEDLLVSSSVVAREFLSFELAQKIKCLPLSYLELPSDYCLTVALETTYTPEVLQSVRNVTGVYNVKVVTIEPSVLNEAIFKSYGGDEKELISKLVRLNTVKTKKEVELFLPNRLLDSKDDAIGNFLLSLFNYALSRNASDIHLTPNKLGPSLKLRISGQFLTHEGALCNSGIYDRIVNKIKIISGLDIAKSDVVQEGEFALHTCLGERNFRVSILPVCYGERVVLRLARDSDNFRLKELNFSSSTVDILKRSLLSSGLWLLSGPTGSGKTTTLYSLAQEFVARGLNVVSIEDSIEAKLEGVAQVKVGGNKKLSFASTLKAVLRQDPDVILIGEIRDTEVAQLIINASLSGHTVLTTVHAKSVRGTIKRMKQLGVDPSILIESFSVFLSQEVMPKLCSCSLESDKKEDLSLCPLCYGSKYNGLVIITEILARPKTLLNLNFSFDDLLENVDFSKLGKEFYQSKIDSTIFAFQNGWISENQLNFFLQHFE